MKNIPHEIALGGVYMPPLFVATIIGVLLAVFVVRLLNRYRLSKYFFYPPLVFVAIAALFIVMVDTFMFLF